MWETQDSGLISKDRRNATSLAEMRGHVQVTITLAANCRPTPPTKKRGQKKRNIQDG